MGNLIGDVHECNLKNIAPRDRSALTVAERSAFFGIDSGIGIDMLKLRRTAVAEPSPPSTPPPTKKCGEYVRSGGRCTMWTKGNNFAAVVSTKPFIDVEDNAPLAAAVADNRSRGQHAIMTQRNAPLAHAWFGDKWSGDYPDGIFEWRWEDCASNAPISKDTWANENGTTGWAVITRSSNADYFPGLYKVHHCAHMPCKCSFSQTSMFGLSDTPLHLFGTHGGIGMLNAPQSRNAAEADAVAEPSPPSTPPPTKKFEEYVRSGGRWTTKEIAGMRIPNLLLSKSEKDKKSKKAKKPKKIKNAATDTINAKNNKSKGNGKSSGHMKVICVPDAAMNCGQEVQLAVEASDTIGYVKQEIFKSTGIWPTNQYVKFSGKHLSESKTLAFYNIPDGANLTYASSAAVAAAAARSRVEKRRRMV